MGSIPKPRCDSCQPRVRWAVTGRSAFERRFLARTHYLPKLTATRIDTSILFAARCCRRFAQARTSRLPLMPLWRASLSRAIKQRWVFRAAKDTRIAGQVACRSVVEPRRWGQLASEFLALSADHLEHTDQAGVVAMARAKTVAVLLPGAFYFIRETTKPPVELFRAQRRETLHSPPIATPAARR